MKEGNTYRVCLPRIHVLSSVTVILDSEAAISVAPKSYFNKVPITKDSKSKYILRDSEGNLIKVNGTREIPYKFGKATV